MCLTSITYVKIWITNFRLVRKRVNRNISCVTANVLMRNYYLMEMLLKLYTTMKILKFVVPLMSKVYYILIYRINILKKKQQNVVISLSLLITHKLSYYASKIFRLSFLSVSQTFVRRRWRHNMQMDHLTVQHVSSLVSKYSTSAQTLRVTTTYVEFDFLKIRSNTVIWQIQNDKLPTEF